MTDTPLFDPGPAAVAPEDEQLSATRRLTARNNELIASGLHPATLRRLAVSGGTCGDCAHLVRIHHHDRHYLKCALHRLGQSHSSASDIRASWPACTLHTAPPEDS